MSPHSLTTPLPVQNLQVYPGGMFRVAHGANEGDQITEAGELMLEDIYELDKGAEQARLAIAVDDASGAFVIAAGSGLGAPGAPLFLDCLITLMGPNGSTDEALVLIELDPDTGMIAQSYLHPLTPLETRAGYALITVDRNGAAARLAETACVSFMRGTHITMADGRQAPIETLRPGDKVLTRDSGPQAVRWVGEQTVRATGAFAPIVIAPGALNNAGVLTVSPNHRLFVYQRVDTMGTGQREILVKARLLVNGSTVTQTPGGFVDYFQLLFDKHEIIYAEGIAAESLFIDTSTRPAMPDELRRRLKGDITSTHGAHELRAAEVDARDAAALLKRASLN